MANKKITIKQRAKNTLKFERTEYGKKLYRNMLIWGFLTLIIIVGTTSFNISEEYDTIVTLGEWLVIAISAYHDGKYVGALEMYNKK